MITVIFGNVAQFLLLLLTMRLATSYLPPAEMGRLSLITATIAFFALFLVNPVGMFINRRLHAWDALGCAKHYLKLHWFFLLTVSLLAIISLVILNAMNAFGHQFSTSWLLLLVGGSLLFNSINQTAVPSLNLLELRGRFFALTLATLGTGLVGSYLLVKHVSPTAEYWQLGLLIGQVVFAVIGVKVLFSKLQTSAVRFEPAQTNVKLMFSYVWPIAVSVGFNWVQTQGYRFFVADSLGLAALGLFVAGYGISVGLVAGFEAVVTTYFQPTFYKDVNSNDKVVQSLAWNRYAAAILPSLLLVMFLLVGLAPELTRFLVGPAYQSASQFVVWGVLAEGARVAGGVYGLSAYAKMKTQLLLLPNILAAIVSTVFVLLLPSFMGAHGVGLARLLASVSMVGAMHYLMVSTLEMKFPCRLLIKSITMGTLLLLIAIVSRWLLGGTTTLIGAGLLIMVMGLIFLPMFYWLMLPFLSKNTISL